MNFVKKILKWVVAIFLIIIIIVNFTLIIKSEINKEEIPDFFGYTPFIIVSGSMEPTIKTNDVIITKEIKKADIKVGDILSYKSTEDDIIVTHRVIEIKEESGETIYTLKGDKNSVADEEVITYSKIHGKYLCSIPFIGILVTYIQTPIGMCMVIGVVLLVYVIFDIVQRMFEKDELTKMSEKLNEKQKEKEHKEP